MVFGRLRKASEPTKSEDSNKEGMLGILRARRSKQDLVNLDDDTKEQSRKSPISSASPLKPLGIASEDLLPSLLYDDSPPSSNSSSSNPTISTSSNAFRDREGEEESQSEEEEDEDDYGSESHSAEGETTTTVSTSPPVLASSAGYPHTQPLGPRASRIESITKSRLFPPQCPSRLSPMSTRPANTSAFLRHDSRLATTLGRIGVLVKLRRGLTSRETIELDGRIDRNLTITRRLVKEEDSQKLSRLLRDEYRPSKRPSSPIRVSRFSSSKSPSSSASVLPVLPELESWHSRSPFISTHLVWNGTDKSGNLTVGETIQAREFKQEEVIQKLPVPVGTKANSTIVTIPPVDDDTPSAPSVASPPSFESPRCRRFLTQPSSVFDQPLLEPNIPRLAPMVLQVASGTMRDDATELKWVEEDRREREREQLFPQGRRKQPVKDAKEDPRQKEIQKRLADQRRRSELMHTKIQPRDRKPSKSNEKRPSTTAEPIPLEPTFVHSPSRFSQATPLWLATPPIAFASTIPLPHQLPQFSTPAPAFRSLSPVPSFAPLQPQLSSSPPRQRQLSVPVRAQSPPSPVRPVPHRSNSIPLQPPRKLVVVPPPPPVRADIAASSPSSPPVSPPLLPTSNSSATLAGSRSDHANRARRLSTIEPLIKDVRPPKAWSLPHAPSVSGRKTVEKETNS
ncbi:hypothetical protein JCM5350_005758 [Sporobolomyces pararoseus]